MRSRSNWKILFAALAATLTLPLLASADAVDEQLDGMTEQMRRLEAQLQATQDKLAESKEVVANQQQQIERAGLERETQSGLSAFLSETQFSGLLAASYNYNFNSPDASSVGWNAPGTIMGESIGNYALTAPLHSNSNNFQVDQFWLSMMKPATPESRGGWGVDLVWGAAADANSLATFTCFFGEGCANATGDLPHLYQAYVEYLVPVLQNGVNVKAGRFETLVGAEVLRADGNWQITRGIVWSMQPVNHTGMMISTEFDNGINIALGGVNSYDNTQSDYDNEKTFIGQVGWTGETASFKLNGVYGGDVWNVPGPVGNFAFWNADKDEVGLLDVVATWDPTEDLSMWANFDYYWTAAAGSNVSSLSVWGVAGAFRYALTDHTGFSFRGEYLYFNDADILLFSGQPFNPDQCPLIWNCLATGAGPGLDSSLLAFTGTIDHALTDNLTVKVEGRYDIGWAQGVEDNFFIDNESFANNEDQVLALIQAMYTF